jgi:hypothetical protein
MKHRSTCKVQLSRLVVPALFKSHSIALLVVLTHHMCTATFAQSNCNTAGLGGGTDLNTVKHFRKSRILLEAFCRYEVLLTVLDLHRWPCVRYIGDEGRSC